MTAGRTSSRVAPLLVLLALIGLGIAGYLLIVRLQGELPAWGTGGRAAWSVSGAGWARGG